MNNKYDSISVVPNTPTVVNSLTVPTRSGYSFKGVILWTDADCEITLKLNLDTIGGGRINGATQTLFLDFSSSPYGIGAGDTVLVFATQEGSAAHDIKSVLLIEQL